MVKADVTYKIKQSNGTITNYKEEKVEADTYDDFLNTIEQEIRKLKDKIGRTIRFDVENFVRENNQLVSTDMNAKKAIQVIENKSKEDVEEFIAEDEDRVTVKRAYNKKFNNEDKKEE